jgi:hypothetical protein
MSRNAMTHSILALTVIAAAAGSAHALDGHCSYTAPLAVDKSLVMKIKAGSEGGKMPVRSALTLCYFEDTLRVGGWAYVETSRGDRSKRINNYDLVPTKVKLSSRTAQYKGDTKRLGGEDAKAYGDLFIELFGSLNNETLDAPLETSRYRPLTEGFTLDRVKLKVKAKLESDGQRTGGKLQINAKGRTFSGKRLKGSLKLKFRRASFIT